MKQKRLCPERVCQNLERHNVLKFTLSGHGALLVHNGHLADPDSYFAMELAKVSKKRGKTESDRREMSRLEFLGGLYLNDQNQPIIPMKCLRAAIIKAARATKQGKIAEAALFIQDDALIQYEGPSDPHELFEDDRFVSREVVKVGQARVVRTRPKFQDWKLEFTVDFLDDMVDADTIEQWVERCGRSVGLGDWRPLHGRFDVVRVENLLEKSPLA